MAGHRNLFSYSLDGQGDRLHVAAHSHHLWPDVTRAAHMQAWDDAARMADTKWGEVLGTQWGAAKSHLARLLDLPDPDTLCIAPNVHELLVRLVSAVQAQPVRILSTGSEFHSFTRQAQRWVEAGLATWETVPTEPFDTLAQRFDDAVQAGGHDLIYASHVFFDSGYRFDEVFRILHRAPADTLVAVDGYHGFMAVPTDLTLVSDRVFYLSGGYKYAMTGEGFCFIHCPPGLAERPVDTGWFAHFDGLADADTTRVSYAPDGNRFFGATFDGSCIYRFNAVQQMLGDQDLAVADLHRHSLGMQERFLDGLSTAPLGLTRDQLVVQNAGRRGNFLTFRRDDAAEVQKQLLDAGIVTDARADRLRFGFGLYHDEAMVDALLQRIHRV